MPDAREEISQESRVYDPTEAKGIRVLYVVAGVLWLILCTSLGIFRLPDPLGVYRMLFLLPLIVFAVAMLNAGRISRVVENLIIKFNYLSVGLAIVFPFFSWLFSKYNGHSRGTFLRIMIAAFFSTILSMYDLWLPERHMHFYKHGKSVLQTFSLTLILMGLYTYYLVGVGSESG